MLHPNGKHSFVGIESFQSLFDSMIAPHSIASIASQCHSGRGAPAKLPTAELIASTVYHELQPHGTQAEHARQLTGKSLTDGALCLRRQQLDARVFRQVLDAREYPAAELLALYAQRWEQELATDELKNKLHGGHRLRSQTPVTAVQEMAALVMAQGVVARVRVRVAGAAAVPALRVSVGKTLSEVQTLWRALQWGDGVLKPKQVHALVEGCMESLERQLTGRRRKRNCVRAVRQPVSSWPRVMETKSVTGPVKYAVIKIK